MLVQPGRCLLEQEEADVLAAFEGRAQWLIEAGVHIGELDRQTRHDRKAAVGGIGDARETVDGGHFDWELDSADAR